METEEMKKDTERYRADARLLPPWRVNWGALWSVVLVVTAVVLLGGFLFLINDCGKAKMIEAEKKAIQAHEDEKCPNACILAGAEEFRCRIACDMVRAKK
jgi:hypothetical protein